MGRRVLYIAHGMERLVTVVGRLSGWLMLALMAVIVIDVLLRRWFVIGSTALQELEWHLHGALFLLTLGYAYLRGAHVRIELIHERLEPRKKAWVEFGGLLLALLPYCIAIMWFASDYAARAFIIGESSPSPAGLPSRWIIKSILLIGFALLGLAGLARLIRVSVFLFGPPELANDTGFASGDVGEIRLEDNRT